jgi:hypothetical protein
VGTIHIQAQAYSDTVANTSHLIVPTTNNNNKDNNNNTTTTNNHSHSQARTPHYAPAGLAAGSTDMRIALARSNDEVESVVCTKQKLRKIEATRARARSSFSSGANTHVQTEGLWRIGREGV